MEGGREGGRPTNLEAPLCAYSSVDCSSAQPCTVDGLQ